MNHVNTENLDSILQTADKVEGRLHQANYMPDDILSDGFFNEVIELMDLHNNNISRDTEKLNDELRSQFMSQTESRLQDRFANYLIYQIKVKLRPLYNDISSAREDFQHQPYGEGHTYESAGYSFLWNTERVLYAWIDVLMRNIKIFSPERYQDNRNALDIPVYDEDGPDPSDRIYELTTTDELLQLKELSAKLKWKEVKGGKTDLAELIWALAKSGRIIDSVTFRPVTIDELTRQFETLFGLSINTTGLMQGRKDSYKAAEDGITFTTTLSELVNDYIAKQ